MARAILKGMEFQIPEKRAFFTAGRIFKKGILRVRMRIVFLTHVFLPPCRTHYKILDKLAEIVNFRRNLHNWGTACAYQRIRPVDALAYDVSRKSRSLPDVKPAIFLLTLELGFPERRQEVHANPKKFFINLYMKNLCSTSLYRKIFSS